MSLGQFSSPPVSAHTYKPLLVLGTCVSTRRVCLCNTRAVQSWKAVAVRMGLRSKLPGGADYRDEP